MLLVHSFSFIFHHRALLSHELLLQLWVCTAALGVACAIGLPLGVATGHLHRYSFLALSGSNALRALPSLAVIAILFTLVGLGFINIMLALVILAIPPILTNTYVAVSSVDSALVQAARAAGMRADQVVFKVELPVAVPLIFTGLRVAALYTIASAYLAAFAGLGGTLGDVIVAEGVYGLAGVLGATIVVLAVAFAVDGILGVVQTLVTPRGLRLATRDTRLPGGSAAAGGLAALDGVVPGQARQ